MAASSDNENEYGWPKRVQDCAKCRRHYETAPLLAASFASVGMEYGKSQLEMADSYFDWFHKRGHRE